MKKDQVLLERKSLKAEVTDLKTLLLKNIVKLRNLNYFSQTWKVNTKINSYLFQINLKKYILKIYFFIIK